MPVEPGDYFTLDYYIQVLYAVPVWMWIAGSVVAVLALVGGAIGLVIKYGHDQAKKQLEPLPTDEQLEQEGGRYFPRPSDGKQLEYFTVPARAAVGAHDTAVVAVHGLRRTGYGLSRYDEQQMKGLLSATSSMLLCPSFPGFGASEPYDEELTAVPVLEAFSRDVMHLVQHLGVKRVVVLGLEFGVEPAFHFAVNAMRMDMLVAAGAINGMPWSTKDFDSKGPEESKAERKARRKREKAEIKAKKKQDKQAGKDPSPIAVPSKSNAWHVPILSGAMMYYFARPALSKSQGNIFEVEGETDETRAMREAMPEEYTILSDDVRRSARYFLHNMLYHGEYAQTRSELIKAHYATLRSSVPVQLHHSRYGDDPHAQHARQYLAEAISHAETIEYEGFAMQMPLVQVVESLLRVSDPSSA